ncbi:MAG: C10 family peptidase [Syntrophothermus sp.]
MKKTFTLLSVFALILSLTGFAKKVDKNSAQLAGKNFYYEVVNARKAVPYQEIRITSDFTVSRENEAVYYVFNINNDEGFIIISADDAAAPVIGYSFTGSYSDENQPSQFVYWMNNKAEEISWIRNRQLQPDLDITTTWNRLLSDDPADLQIDRGSRDVEPLLSCTWDQSFPYNSMCPQDPGSSPGYNGRVPVGCVATAMAQIMFYWRYPEVGQGSHCIVPQPSYGPQCANFGQTTYDWNGMSNAPGSECDPVALISYHAGVSVDMHYAPDGSGSYLNKIPNAMKNYFKYSTEIMYVTKVSYSTTGWEDLLKGDLDNGQPLEYGGQDPANGGHAWVCDGYQGTNFFHFNWGWGGAENGYFYLTNLNPSGYNFSQSQNAVVHIKPLTTGYPAGCTGSKDVKTYDYGTIEDGSGPVSDYASNSNCSWLIAPDDSVMSISLTFNRMDTDPNDVIKVYDGDNTSATLLGTYSGTTPPTAPIASTGPKMLVTFTTDGATTGNGFLASYQSQVTPFCNSNGMLTTAEGTITDGSGRFPYRNGQSCKWKIQPVGATSITLVFDSINTEATNDYIDVYDYVTSQKLGTYSGTTVPPSVTSGGKMMIVFKTNSTIRGGGFGASYTTIVGTEDKTVNDLRVFPNPVQSKLNVNFDIDQTTNIRLEIVSTSGIQVFSKDLGMRTGNISEQINLNNVASGIYVLRIHTGQGITNRKIVVE